MDGQLFREDLINFISAHKSLEIGHCIQEVARGELGSTTPHRIRWDLIRCSIDRDGDSKPHGFKVATRETPRDQYEGWYSRDDDAYTVCIRIEVSNDDERNLPKLITMRDILTRNIDPNYQHLDLIPLRHHPIYSMFSVEFTTNLKNRSLNFPPGLWYRSRAVFMPVPETVYSQCPTQYVMHNWKDKSLLELWVRKMRRLEREKREAESMRRREERRIRKEERKRIELERLIIRYNCWP